MVTPVSLSSMTSGWSPASSAFLRSSSAVWIGIASSMGSSSDGSSWGSSVSAEAISSVSSVSSLSVSVVSSILLSLFSVSSFAVAVTFADGVSFSSSFRSSPTASARERSRASASSSSTLFFGAASPGLPGSLLFLPASAPLSDVRCQLLCSLPVLPPDL